MWASYYTCSIIRDVNLFCDNRVIITDWKNNVLLLSISRNSLQNNSIFLLEKFTAPNSLILVKDLTRGKRGFDIFFIDHYVGDIGNKNITGEY